MSADETPESRDDRPIPLWAIGVVLVVFLVMTALVGGVTLLVVVGGLADSESDAADASRSQNVGAAETAVPADRSTPTAVDPATSTPAAPDGFAVRIRYAGSWQGAVSVTGDGSSQTESVAGSGTTTIDVSGAVDVVSANAQKQDDSSAELTVQILRNGDVVAESSTTAGYGVAQVSESFY